MKNLFLLIIFPCVAFTQQTDHWYFGVNAGIDFSSSTATAVYGGALNASGGTASMSDSTGALLFYTDGLTVWNRYHQPMPNGNGTLGGGFGSQPVIIVPDPANANQYYVFTTDGAGGVGGLRYSIVDMSLLSDSGDVTTTAVQLVTPVDEKVISIRHANGTDYWVITHAFGNDAFYAYLVTASGVNTPVISHTGISHDSTALGNSFGQMKFNNCGTRLAVAAGYKDSVQVFDFDATTGVVSNPLTIPFHDHVYGIEFSQDASRLYVSDYNADTSLVQFDLTQTTAAAVVGSATGFFTTSQVYSLQLGPDSNIYAARGFMQFLGVVQDPDSIGLAANFIENGLDLDPLLTGLAQGALGLPGFMQSYLATGPCGPTGIPELNDEHFMTWQNPSPLSVQLRTNASCFVRIFNPSGSLVLEKRIQGNTTIDLEQGIYFVSMEMNGKQRTERLVVVE